MADLGDDCTMEVQLEVVVRKLEVAKKVLCEATQQLDEVKAALRMRKVSKRASQAEHYRDNSKEAKIMQKKSNDASDEPPSKKHRETRKPKTGEVQPKFAQPPFRVGTQVRVEYSVSEGGVNRRKLYNGTVTERLDGNTRQVVFEDDTVDVLDLVDLAAKGLVHLKSQK
mmetsp:Transcript_39204/g.80301  ORF Transcript_39204/g.80301 Transcript_39204/m.80301 type:complete len:169 (-) Transcript_39204:120-626(-)